MHQQLRRGDKTQPKEWLMYSPAVWKWKEQPFYSFSRLISSNLLLKPRKKHAMGRLLGSKHSTDNYSVYTCDTTNPPCDNDLTDLEIKLSKQVRGLFLLTNYIQRIIMALVSVQQERKTVQTEYSVNSTVKNTTQYHLRNRVCRKDEQIQYVYIPLVPIYTYQT